MVADKLIRAQHYRQLSVPELMQKLDELYDKEEGIKKAYAQVRDDIELMQSVIMHTSNKKARSIVKP